MLDFYDRTKEESLETTTNIFRVQSGSRNITPWSTEKVGLYEEKRFFKCKQLDRRNFECQMKLLEPSSNGSLKVQGQH